MSLPEPFEWKNYNKRTGQGDPSTPMTAANKNLWWQQFRDKALELVGRAETAADQAEAPTDAMVSSLATPGSGSQLEATLNGTYVRAIVLAGPGIDPTGATDSTAAMQAKLDAAPAGSVVVIPDGLYTATTLTLSKSLTIQGSGATIRQADGVAPTGNDYTAALLRVTSHITVRLRGLVLDGNYAGQGSANGGTATRTSNAYVSGGTLTFGRIISADDLSPAAGERLELDVEGCHFTGQQMASISIEGPIDVASTEILRVHNCRFDDFAPGIVAYDGTNGYSSATFGFDPTAVNITGKVDARITDSVFEGFRDPTVTPTSGFTTNVYNEPICAIRVTIPQDGVDDPTPEFGALHVSGCTFTMMGRHLDAGNSVGVIDWYARARDVRVLGCRFMTSWNSALRGKSSCDGLALVSNMVDTVTGAGIEIAAATYAPQLGAHKITGNVIRDTTGRGITVAGSDSLTPAYVADIDISGNTINGCGAEGIFLRRAQDVRVAGNVVQTTTGVGVYADQATGHYSLTDNVIRGTDSNGVAITFLAAATTNTVTVLGNRITDGSGYGIYVRYAQTVRAVSNSIATMGGVSRGFYFDDTAGECVVLGNDASTGVSIPAFNFNTTETPGLREGHNSWNARHLHRSAAPVDGTWRVGDVVWSTAPTAGGSIGWVCTTAGTPGTWKTFGAVAA